MPQSVRVNPSSRGARDLVDGRPNPSHSQAPTAPREEEGKTRTWSRRVEIAADQVGRTRVKGNPPLDVAFPVPHVDDLVDQVDVGDVERGELADAKSRVHGDRHDRRVTECPRGNPSSGSEGSPQAGKLGSREEEGESATSPPGGRRRLDTEGCPGRAQDPILYNFGR